MRRRWRRKTPARRRGARPGLTLLEVVLALAILAGSAAAIGELVRQGVRHVQVARDATQAQLLCESKLAELNAGLIPPEPAASVPIDGAEGWLYSIEIQTLEIQGVIGVQLTVEQDASGASRPVRQTVVQWMPDPATVAAAEEAKAAAEEAAATAAEEAAASSTSAGSQGGGNG